MNIQAFFSQLDNYFNTGKIAEAEPFMLNQLAAANQENDSNASVVIMNELIGFYRAQKRHEDSVRVTEQALAFCRQLGTEGTLEFATTLLNGATAYRFAGQPQKAMELFNQCEAIYNEKLTPGDYHFAGLYNNISSACVDLGQTERAMEYLKGAANIVDRMPERYYEAATTHANLAAMHSSLQNWSSAADEMKTACDILRGKSDVADMYEEFTALESAFRQRI
jgi:tetratricopeptide repeat protein